MTSITKITAAVKGAIDGGEAEEVALSLSQARRLCRDLARYAPGRDGPAPEAEPLETSLDVLGSDLDYEAERARELAELAGAWHVPAGTPMEVGYTDWDCGLGEPWEDTDEDALGREMYEHATIRHHARLRADRGTRDEAERWGGGCS